MKYHCGNHGCIMGGVTGMATNGKCRCLADITPEKRIRLGAGIRALRERVRVLTDALRIIGEPCACDRGSGCSHEIARAALANGGGKGE